MENSIMANDHSNRLPVLAEEIRIEHQKVLAAAGAGIAAARAAGAHLIEAKAAIPHGAWLSWLAGLGFGVRTAQNYMKLARLPEATAQRIAHLGLARGLREIADQSDLLSPRSGEIVQGQAGLKIEIDDVELYEREVYIWRSSQYPDFFWLFALDTDQDGSGSSVTVRKPVPDAVWYLEHWGFPIEAARWETKRDAGLISCIADLRVYCHGGGWIYWDAAGYAPPHASAAQE